MAACVPVPAAWQHNAENMSGTANGSWGSATAFQLQLQLQLQMNLQQLDLVASKSAAPAPTLPTCQQFAATPTPAPSPIPIPTPTPGTSALLAYANNLLSMQRRQQQQQASALNGACSATDWAWLQAEREKLRSTRKQTVQSAATLCVRRRKHAALQQKQRQKQTNAQAAALHVQRQRQAMMLMKRTSQDYGAASRYSQNRYSQQKVPVPQKADKGNKAATLPATASQSPPSCPSPPSWGTEDDKHSVAATALLLFKSTAPAKHLHGAARGAGKITGTGVVRLPRTGPENSSPTTCKGKWKRASFSSVLVDSTHMQL